MNLPPRSNYRFKDTGRGVGRERFQNHIKQPSCNYQIWRASWKKTFTTFRPLPVPTGNGDYAPYRYSAEPDDFGDWIRTYNVITRYGANDVTCIINDPLDETYDINENPFVLLRNSLEIALKTGQDRQGWAMLKEGTAQRGALVPDYQANAFLPALLFEHNSKIFEVPKGFGQDDGLVLMQLSPSATNALIGAANEVVEGTSYRDVGENFIDFMKYGDLISPLSGKFITLFEEGATRQQAAGANNPTGRSWAQINDKSKTGDNDKGGFSKYAIEVNDEFMGIPSALQTDEVDVFNMIAPKLLPWDRVLTIPDEEEQALMVAKGCPKPDLVEYAFSAVPRHFTSDVMAILRNKTSLGVNPSDAPAPAASAPAPQMKYPGARPTGAPAPTPTPGAAGLTRSSWTNVTGAANKAAESVPVPTPGVSGPAAELNNFFANSLANAGGAEVAEAVAEGSDE
jgi:hypothetical protein